KAEPAAWRIELQRRHAEIGQRTVDERHPPRVEDGVDRAVIGVNELDAIAPGRERFLCERQRLLVAIEADEARRAAVQERACMAAEADRAVDKQPAALRLQMLQHLGGEHGDVSVHQMPNSDRARASSSVYGSRCSLLRNRS